jgi:hypothetical protein
MTMILTLKSASKGLYTIEIRKPYGDIEYKQIEPEKLYDFIQAYEYYSEVNGFKFLFRFDESVKRYCKERLKDLVESYNNSSNA